MRFDVRAAIALTMALSGASAYADNGTILFTRPVVGSYSGAPANVGSGLFLIHDNGTGYQQLTPLVPNSYYLGSGVIYGQPNNTQATWPTRNFSPDGQYIQYFAGESSSPNPAGTFPGKYYVKSLLDGSTYALFPGANDNAPPGVGYLTWGPAGSNEIAYTNSTDEIAVSSPCVQLMHTDGSDQHTLWCAPAVIPYEAASPLAISGLRWSGNGQMLLADVSYEPPPLTVPRKALAAPKKGGTGWVALYAINVQTGAATLVAPDVPDDLAFSDISYNGNVVLYQQAGFQSCGDTNTESIGVALCAMNLTTGVVTELLPQNYWTSYEGNALEGFMPTALLSPDGSEAALSLQALGTAVFESDIYIVKTDGSNTLRQLTTRPPNTPASLAITWIPVAWAPDGCQLLANNIDAQTSETGMTIEPSQIHIFAMSDGKDWHVTQGVAIDWLKQ